MIARRTSASTDAPSSRSLESDGLFDGFDERERITVWMSHGDHVETPPHGLRVTARSATVQVAAMRHRDEADLRRAVPSRGCAHAARRRDHRELPLRGVRRGADVDAGRVHRRGDRARSRAQVGTARVICGLSGGVDSSVAAALVHRAIGDQLTCIFVDTGLLRLHEREQVERTFRAHLGHRPRHGRRERALPRRARRRRGSGGEAARASATRSSTCSRTRRRTPGSDAQLPRAGHALSRRDRVGVAARRPVGDDQDAPQRRRARSRT